MPSPGEPRPRARSRKRRAGGSGLGAGGEGVEGLLEILLSFASSMPRAGAQPSRRPPAARAEAARRALDGLLFLHLCERSGRSEHGPIEELGSGGDAHERLEQALARAEAMYGRALGLAGSGAERISDEAIHAAARRLSDPGFAAGISLETPGELHERLEGEALVVRGGEIGLEAREGGRKSRGVYYTPRRVVETMVSRSLLALGLAERSEGPSELRVLDPACGAGSFLLGVYRALSTMGGGLRAPREERARLLARCLHGVDLDPGAVLTTRRTLLLAALWGESLPREIPELEANIRVGDALVGPEARGFGLGAREAARMRVFDFRGAFPEILGGGGFDLVIGNPPYVSYGGRQKIVLPPSVSRYFAARYRASGWRSSHSLFLERAVTELSGQVTAFLLPDQVGHLEGYGALRELCLERAGLWEARYWGDRMFAGVITPSLSVVLDRGHDGPSLIVEADGRERIFRPRGRAAWSASPLLALRERLQARSRSLGAMVGDPGVRTTRAGAQLVPLGASPPGSLPVLEGKQISRYACEKPRLAVRTDSGHTLYRSSDERYRQASFLIRQTAAYPVVGPHEHALHFRNSLLALYPPGDGTRIEYVVGLLNSRLLRFLYTHTVRESRQRIFPQVKVGALRGLPIRWVDLGCAEERASHDQMVSLVERMLALGREATGGSSEASSGPPGDERARLDQRIDRLVYDLYGLTEEEVRLVEGACPGPSPVKPETEPTPAGSGNLGDTPDGA